VSFGGISARLDDDDDFRITSVLTKLASSKIKLEKVCAHGPPAEI